MTTLFPMNSIFRYVLVIAVFFVVAVFVSTDKISIAAAPAEMPGKHEDPMEQVYRSVRFVGSAPIQKEWTLKDFQSELEDAFRKGDPCGVSALLEQEAPISPAIKWAAGMEVFLRWVENSNPTLTDLFASSDSPLYGYSAVAQSGREKIFFQALRASGQWNDGEEDGAERISFKEVDEAVNQLKALSQEDPENGIYSFFLAQALRLMGAKKEEVESAYIQASKASKFDAFYQNRYDELLKLSYANMGTFSWVYLFLHSAPEPNFSIAVRNLRNWASDSEPGKWISSKLAKKLIDMGVRYKTESPGYLISQQEYMLGHSLKYSFDSRFTNDREELVTKMKEAKDFISEVPGAVGAAEAEIFMSQVPLKGVQECNWSSWQNLYDSYKAKGK